jgi:hypothetical protein
MVRLESGRGLALAGGKIARATCGLQEISTVFRDFHELSNRRDFSEIFVEIKDLV